MPKAPQPYIERLVWSIVENRDTQLLKFRSGDLDISEPMRPEDPLLKHEEKRGKFTKGPRPITVLLLLISTKDAGKAIR